MKPRRSENSTVQSRSTPPRRRLSSVRASTSSTTSAGTKRENTSRTRSRSIVSLRYSTASVPERGQRKREQRVDEADDQPLSNASWVAIVNTTASRERVEQRAQRSQAQAAERREHAEQHDQEQVQPAGRVVERHAAHQRRRSRWPRFPVPAICAPVVVAVAWTSCRIGAEAPTITIFPPKAPAGKLPASTLGVRVGARSCRGRRRSRSAGCRRG